jgi:ClpP class serine protease
VSERAIYERAGMLALEPRAFLDLFLVSPQPVENRVLGDVEVVDIRGPLDTRTGGVFDSYEAITARVRIAAEGKSKAIVLRIDSPGGEAAGVVEAARTMRAAAAAAGKPLFAFVDGKACSAAYGLACAAQRIVIGYTAIVGSIGIINTRRDMSGADAAQGQHFTVVASGNRKKDGHPHVAATPEEIAATKAQVDSLAEVFVALVGELRGLDPARVKDTEAGTYHGQAAIHAGLADQVGSFDEALAAVVAERKETPMAAKTLGSTPRAGDYEDGRAALERAAKGEGKQAAGAKRALAALDAEPDDDDKKDDDAKKAEGGDDDKKDDDKKDDDAKKAEGGDDDKKDDDKKDEKAEASSSLETRLAKLETRYEAADRSALLATRPDIPESLSKALASKPLAIVREILDATPRQAAPKHAAAASTIGTRGATQGAPAPSAEANEMDLRMGLIDEQLSTRRVGNVQQFGVFPKAATAAGGAK